MVTLLGAGYIALAVFVILVQRRVNRLTEMVHNISMVVLELANRTKKGGR